ncbi:hypothetical protein LSH36_640g01062 [Paralvinella palmiformis]|uniref:Uncharacterized protein n=1 Tax=Paralvinella palmiformis TaxID=53620 RepID=A0AAD9MW32_9ANNE|nr:hypothetical protein LSH36_640g01062 [Paralvinella palmiformis]
MNVIRRPKTAQTPQRFKSFGSFGQFDTLIDGDSDDEVLEDLDEKLYATLCRYKSTPNIRKIPCAENRRVTYNPDVCHEKSNYRTRCQTLPNLLDTLADGISRQLTKSTEAIHNELIIKSIPAFEMDFDGFSSQHSSAHIPEPPLREEGNSSLNDSDFYLQYNRNAQRSVSTFLPQDDMEDTPGMKQNPALSFQKHLSGDGDVQCDVGKAQLTSYAQDTMRDYHPEHIREPRGQQQDTSLESAGNTNNSSWKQTSYVLEHNENVLAGNLKKDYPKIAPKPKVKKTKKTKNVVASGTSDVASAFSGLHTYENFGLLQSAGESLQSATDRLEEGFHPDHSSSAVLYAPDGTIFKLPMTGDGIQSSILRVFHEENQSDKPIKVKSKSGKRIKKKSTSLLKDNVGVNASDVDNSTVQGEYGASYSRSYHQTNTSPGIPSDYSSQSCNVYENIHEMNLNHQSGDHAMLQRDKQRGIGGQYYPSNTSFDTSYPKGSASLCEFDPDHHSSSIASGASIHSVPVTPTSPGTSSILMKQTNPRRNVVKSIPVMDAASLPVSNLPDQYFPTSISEAAAAEDGYTPGSGHRVGGRRPAQPPPPPPSSSLASPPPEMYLSNPTKLSHYNQQLTSQPASPDQICISDLDAIVPMSTDEMQQSQPESVHLDYSVPMDGQDAVSNTNVRKSPHRKGVSSSQKPDGSSLPKKPKVAKKPKQIKQKSLDTNYSAPSGLPQQLSSWQDNDVPQQPKETNINDIFQTPSADVQQEMHISQHVKRVKRMKNRSRSRDAPEMSMPVEEVWIDETPSVLKESNSYTLEQQPDVPDSPFTSSDIANASTPKMIKKKAPHSFSDGSLAPASGQLEAVEINIDNAVASSLPRGVGVWETDIDAADAGPTVVITGRTSPGESKKGKKVVKKKKKITKSVGDISSLVEPCLQPLNAQILETDIDGMRMVSEEPVEGAAGKLKTGKKKKKLNKSTGDINADLAKELVDIDIQLTENEKPKKKIKKKVTKSVGDLSQDLTSDGRLVNVDSSLPLHSFNDTQTLEQPKKKVKKVKKKTKSVGDLTSEEAMSVSVTNIDIDDGQKECVKTGVHPVEKKKKKKKSLKSLAAEDQAASQKTTGDGALVGTDEKREVLLGTSCETCIDDMFSERLDKQAVLASFSHETCIDDVIAPRREVQQAPYETCIDDVLPQPTEVQLMPRGETYETFIDDVLPQRVGQPVVQMGSPHETCIDDILPQSVQKENPPNETCIDDLFPQMAEKQPISVQDDYGRRDVINAKSFHASSSAQSEKENLYENINQLSYNINSFKSDIYDDSQKGMYEFGAEEMDALPETYKQPNVDQHMPEITETNVDADFYDPLPVSSRQGQTHEAGDSCIQSKCLEQGQDIDQLADQRLYAKETTIDDVFDGTQITSSPQELSMEPTISERWPEKPKKVKKKRSKSVERGKILQEDGTLLQSQLSLDSEKKVKRKKKKLTKSTGDLTDVGRVVVNIDIDMPSTKIQKDESADHHPTEGGTATRKVKKVKKKSITASSMSEEIPNFDQNAEPVAANLETDPDEKKKKKKVVKKKLHKSTGDLHMLPASLVPGQEIFVDNTDVTVVEPGRTEDSEKKKKRVVKKRVKKSTITVEETNVDDLVTTKMGDDRPSRLHDDDHAVVMTSSNITDVGVYSDQRPTSQEMKKRKVSKKSKMKSTSDLTDLSTMEVALVQETDTNDATVNGSAFPKPTALSGVDPTVKKKKKVVKKKINKSLSDLTQSGSSNLAEMEISFTQEADIGGISENITPIQDPLGVPETDLVEKKKKKVVKRKKLNKSLSDLSQLQSSTLVNFSALDEPVPPQTDNNDVTITVTPAQDTDGVTLIDGSQKRRKRVVKKKKANKSLSDLNEPLPSDMNLLINDTNVPAMMECSTDGSMQPSAGIVKEDVPKKRRTVKKKKSVGDQIDAIATIAGVDVSDVQQMDDVIIIQRGIDIDGSLLEEAQMTPIMQQEEAQTVMDESNTEPLPSASNLDDIFLDKETMNTVVGDVLVGSTLKDNAQGGETIGPYKDYTGKSQPPRDMSIILPAAQSIDIARITPMTDAANVLPNEISHQTPFTCINQTMENTEVIQRDYQDKRQKSKKEELVISAGMPSGYASAEIPSLIVSNKENKKTKKKKKKTSQDVVSDVTVEPMMSPIDISDIPLIDSDISDSVFEQRLNELNAPEKSPFQTETSISPVVEQGKSIAISPDRYEKKYPDLTVKQGKTIDVVVDELNNNTAELGSETIRTTEDGDINKQQVTCSTDLISQLLTQPPQEYKSDQGLPDGHSFSASQLPKKSYEAFKKPEAISIFHTSGTRQLSSETDQSSDSFSTEPMDGTSDRMGSIPVKVHRKKNYTPVQYRPWTDILFGTAKPKIKVTRKEPPSTERSLNSSFVDSSFDSQVEKWSDGKTSYTTEISDGIPVEVKSEPTASSQDEMEQDDHQKEQPRIERKSSLRKQTKSLENLLNAEEDGSFSMTTYNKYEDLDDDESTRNRIRTKSVDNLTLLQQRKRQVSTDRSIENKREHSKSTGCLLEGRIAKLARKTLTQELLYETVTTVEEVVVIKRPLDASVSLDRKESEMKKPKETKRNVSGKERRYLGSLVIVDIYDDKESATESSPVDVADESRESNYLTDTSMIQSAIGTIVSDFRRSSSASEKTDTSQEFSRHDDDTSSMRSSNMSTEIYSERQTMTDISNKELLTCDQSVEVVETCVTAKVSDVDVQKEESEVVAIQAKEVPVDVSPVHLQVIGQSSTAEVKPAFPVDSPVVIVTETCTIKQDVATLKQSVEISKDEGTQVNLEELEQYAEPKRESQEFSQQIPEERVSKEFSQQTPQEIVFQEFSQQIPEESSDDDEQEDDDDTSDDSATATDGESGDSYDAENADSSLEGPREAEADAEACHQVVLDAIVEEDQETDKEDTNLTENIHTTMITITEEITTIKSSAANTETTVCVNDQFGSEGDGTLPQNAHAEQPTHSKYQPTVGIEQGVGELCVGSEYNRNSYLETGVANRRREPY